MATYEETEKKQTRKKLKEKQLLGYFKQQTG